RRARPRRGHVGRDFASTDRRRPLMAFLNNPRVRYALAAAAAGVIGVVAWLWITAGRETTDDAQVDAHVTQIAARLAGNVLKVHVEDNRSVEAGATLVEIDPRDYQVAVDKARAALADAEAAALAAQTSVPITTQSTNSTLTTAQGGVSQSASATTAAQK